jgi:hypothetical protein
MWIKAAGGLAGLALALAGTAGCGAPAPTGGAATGRSAAPGTGVLGGASAAAATAGPSTNASPVLADGRSAAYLTGLDTARNTVTLDLIEFLTGDAAKAEWRKKHPGDTSGPDNDYMIINNNTKLRTLPVAAGAQCVVLSSLGGTDTKTISFAAFPAFLHQQNTGMKLTAPDIAVLPFWLTVEHGTVVKFEEQFLP